MFLDEVELNLRSGKGGNGAATFYREKGVPFGGPNGSDGGTGGSIIFYAEKGKRTLYEFRNESLIKAEDGSPAQGPRQGADADDLRLAVPVGTVVLDAETGETLADLAQEGMSYIAAAGGRGGKGNLAFTSSVRQAPKFAQKGAPAEEITVRLELKLLADIGLVGLPNAGKSTLLGALTRARPKIGAYPFTTLSPNLGVASWYETTFTIADLPGLIEGASEGAGLGDRFLRHAERTAALVHVVDAYPIDGTDPTENFAIIAKELEAKDPTLARKVKVVLLNKTDLAGGEAPDGLAESLAGQGRIVLSCSAATGEWLEPVLKAMGELVKERADAAPSEESVVLRPIERRRTPGQWGVEEEEDGFRLTGDRLTKLVAMTPLDNREALEYLHRRLQEIGVIERLREMEAQDGDVIHVGDWEFEYREEW